MGSWWSGQQVLAVAGVLVVVMLALPTATRTAVETAHTCATSSAAAGAQPVRQTP